MSRHTTEARQNGTAVHVIPAPTDSVAPSTEPERRFGLVMVTDDLGAALDGAAFVYTDVWVSMGEADAEWAHRVPLLTPYRVTRR